MSQRDLFTDQAPPHKNRLAAALVTRCQKCKGSEYIDTRIMYPPHNGQTVRRDCKRCGWAMGFPLWYGQRVEASA